VAGAARSRSSTRIARRVFSYEKDYGSIGIFRMYEYRFLVYKHLKNGVYCERLACSFYLLDPFLQSLIDVYAKVVFRRPHIVSVL